MEINNNKRKTIKRDFLKYYTLFDFFFFFNNTEKCCMLLFRDQRG